MNGRKHGKHTQWHDNGFLSARCWYRNDKKHGTCETMSTTGKTIVAQWYNDDTKCTKSMCTGPMNDPLDA